LLERGDGGEARRKGSGWAQDAGKTAREGTEKGGKKRVIDSGVADSPHRDVRDGETGQLAEKRR